MRYLALVLSLALAACSVSMDPQEFAGDIDAKHFSLMEGERDLEGKFYYKKEFHHELLFECREKEKAPYPEMIELMGEMNAIHLDVLDNRGSFYALADSCKKIYSSEDKAQGQMLISKVEDAYDDAQDHLEDQNERFFEIHSRYEELCTEHGIERITHEAYGEDLLGRIMNWQDSLMLQGTMIGANLQQLKNSGIPKKEGKYKDLYRPISEMQAIHKKFQAKILSAENQHSRYDASRQDEWFYVGPYLVERSDVQTLEGEMEKLYTMMTEFRSFDQKFHQLAD